MPRSRKLDSEVVELTIVPAAIFTDRAAVRAFARGDALRALAAAVAAAFDAPPALRPLVAEAASWGADDLGAIARAAAGHDDVPLEVVEAPDPVVPGKGALSNERKRELLLALAHLLDAVGADGAAELLALAASIGRAAA